MIQDNHSGGGDCDAVETPHSLLQERPSSPFSDSGEQPCDQCPDTFAHGHQLTEHLRQVHGNARSHVCTECGKGFATSSGLKQHQHIHSSVKPFQCEVCLKAYTQFSNLCRHKRMHADCRQQIKCHECGQAFSTLHSLNKHKRFCEGVMRGSAAAIHRPAVPSGVAPGFPPVAMSAQPPRLSPGQLPPSAPTMPHPAAALHAYMASLYRPGVSLPTANAFPFPPTGLPTTGMAGIAAGADWAKLMQESMVRQMELYRSSLLLQQQQVNTGKRTFSTMDESASDNDCDSEEDLQSPQKKMNAAKEEDDVNGWDSGLDSAPLEDRKSGSLSGREEADREPSPLRTSNIQHSSTPINSNQHMTQEVVDPTPQVIRPLSFSSPQLTKDCVVTTGKPSSESSDGRLKATPKSMKDTPPSEGELPLDLTVQSKATSQNRTHIFGVSTQSQAESRSPSPDNHSANLDKSVDEATSDEKISSSPAIQFPIHHNDPRDMPTYRAPTIEDLKERMPHQSSGSYPMPNPYLLSRMFGVQEDKLPVPHLLPAFPSMAAFPPRPSPTSFQPVMSPEKLGAFPGLTSPYGMKMGAPAGYGFQTGFNGGKNKYACKFCGKIFPRSANLTRHLRTHTGEQPYKCKYCERSFSISSNLQRHIRNIHNKEKPYRCQICDRSFGQQTNLDRHLKKHEYGTLDTSLDDSVDEDRSLPLHSADHSLSQPAPPTNDINGNEPSLKSHGTDLPSPMDEDDDDEEELDPGSDDLEVSADSPASAKEGCSPVNEYRAIDSSFSINALIGSPTHKPLLPRHSVDAN